MAYRYYILRFVNPIVSLYTYTTPDDDLKGLAETYSNYNYMFLFSSGSTALYGPGPPRFVEFSRSHTLDTPQSIGLLWTSDQPVAETST
jgi:hypothetical protein